MTGQQGTLKKMEFLLLSRRCSSSRNVPGGEERGETDVFAGYTCKSSTNTAHLHDIKSSCCIPRPVAQASLGPDLLSQQRHGNSRLH